MDTPHWLEDAQYSGLQVLRNDGEYAFCRGWHVHASAAQPVLIVVPVSKQPSAHSLARLTHEFGLKDYIGSAWAAAPLELVRKSGHTILLLADPGGEPLSQLSGRPMEIGHFLRVAVATASAVGQMHKGGLIHKDIKPTNILIDRSASRAWLTGFGIASRLPQESQPLAPPELIAGTLAYMAPEQTGHINRPIDLRSDLYSFGVTLYEMLTGTLPFLASDPLQVIHAQIARHPPAPAEKLPGIPEPISAIVMKLLAKAAEERYQSAAGLLADLQHCLDTWKASRRIPSLRLGKHDAPNRLLLRKRLYGREGEIRRLNTAWDRVKTQGASELVLVSGYSGVGKSSIVNELRETVAMGDGLFAGGKFDQYKRDIPFAPLAHAFEGLIRQLLGTSDTELSRWASALTDALGSNGQLMVNLIPALADIIGEQPPVPDLSGLESKNRFLLVFRQFLGVFARPERPLVLFLDDLQWLEPATLEVFEYLATQKDMHHLLLVGAYRNNEVTPEHPLARYLKAVRKSKSRIQEIALGNIRRGDVARLIADALAAEPEVIGPLADAVFEKGGGNPFFTTQFLAALADEGLLTYGADGSAWRWDLDHIWAKNVSDSVVDLMMERLRRLSPASLRVLQHMACLGSRAEISSLCHTLDLSTQETQALLAEPLRSGLLLSIDNAYAFAHDRVQEAVYALLPASERVRAHCVIGARLLAALNDAELDARIFEVVSQLNRGGLAHSSLNERTRAASLNLHAGRRAKASAAYAAACSYLAQGRVLLGAGAWSTHHEIAFSLALEEAECTFLSGDFEKTAALIESILNLAVSNVDKAAVHRLKVELHVVKSQNEEAVESGLAALRLFGIEFSSHPDLSDVESEYARIWINLNHRPIECLVEQPAMTDPQMLAMMRVLAEVWPPAYFTDFNLTTLAICRMVNITLLHGTANASPQGIALLGWLMGPVFSSYEDGYRIVLLAWKLVSQAGSPVDMARTCDTIGLTASWSQPLSVSIDWSRKAYQLGVQAGDRYFACYSSAHAALHLLMSGRHLGDIAGECQDYLEFAHNIDFRDGIDLILSTVRTIASLRGQTRALSSFNNSDFDEDAFEAQLTDKRMSVVVFWYWTRKTMLHFLSGNYEAALASSDKVQPGPHVKIVQLQHLDYHYYTALALAARMDHVAGEPRDALRKRLLFHHQQIGNWAEQTRSPTFADKHALVSAEIARLEGRPLEAECLYEDSIRLARQNGFLQNEGIANEVAARFYEQRGFPTIAHAYLRAARYCFLHWGADAKARQLDELYPEVAQDPYAPTSTSTIAAPVEHLDLATVIKVSQAVSGEIVLEKLLETLMRTALEHAGARRAVLLLVRGKEPVTAAEATISDEVVVVQLGDNPIANATLPNSIIQYVLRSKESVVLSDASAENAYSFDPYLSRHRARSLLCLPLLNQAKLIGVLYLENDLTAHVFTPARLNVLKLLASQAAISLENTRLYRDLAQREARIRRLVDSDVIGIFIWDLDGRLLDANDAFLRMVQYEREDLQAGLRWFDMTPPEWQEAHVLEEADEIKTTGMMRAREKEFFRKDGSRVPVLIGAAAFDEPSNQGVAYILDLTERKRMEAEARESHRRYREVQMELAHANRVTTMGELTGSIAHEVNQPIASAFTNAQAGLRWLGRQPPDLDEVRQAFDRIVENAGRAGEVIDRIRALIKKTPPQQDVLAINGPIREVIELTRTEAVKNRVSVTAELTDGVPLVRGDRVQLQQVMLNLILNAVEAMSGVREGAREVLITTEQDTSGDALVTVRDTGPGLDLPSIERIFEAFYTTKPSGMGMGLSICRSIIEAHGGRLWASANKPRGALFQFTLPRWEDIAPAERASQMHEVRRRQPGE